MAMTMVGKNRIMIDGPKRMPEDSRSHKYSVIIRRRAGRPPVWTWEIQRRPEPLGIRLYEDGFKSPFAAKLAGEKALRQLLDQLAKEE
jgi:hypothetical protein